MGIKYELAEDIMKRLFQITQVLGMEHVKLSGVYAIRSRGSGSSRTIARCHALSKIWQLALGIDAVYLIEVLSEKFDKKMVLCLYRMLFTKLQMFHDKNIKHGDIKPQNFYSYIDPKDGMVKIKLIDKYVKELTQIGLLPITNNTYYLPILSRISAICSIL